jgi:chitinase
MMSQGHDGFSQCTSSNIALLIESAREVMDDIKDLSLSVEAGVKDYASLDEIIHLLAEKKDRVGVLRDISREIAVSLGAAETGRASMELTESAKQNFLDLVAEFQRLIADESSLEDLVLKRGLRISGSKSRRRK